MTDHEILDGWFRREVLPLERSLVQFIRRNWRDGSEVTDLLHDIYALVYSSARGGIPAQTRPYVYAVARNHLINRTKRAKIVSFELIADLTLLDRDADVEATERHLLARDALRQVEAGLEKLPPRVREIVLLRKVEGLNVQETADQLGIGKETVSHQLMMGMKALADHMLGGAGKIVRRRYPPREDQEQSS